MKRAGVVLLFVFLVSVLAVDVTASERPSAPVFTAQSTATIVEVGKPFGLQADQPQAEADKTVGYQVFVNGAPVRTVTKATVFVNGVITIPDLVLTTPGTYQLQLSAYNNDGDSMSLPLTVEATSTTTPPPPPPPTGKAAAPTGLRIIK